MARRSRVVQLREAVEEWRRQFDPPLPTNREFINLVRKNIAEARGEVYLPLLLGPLPKKSVPARQPSRTNNPYCSGCGCHFDDRTPGCRSCRCRHSYRRRVFNKPVARSACKECGCPVDERTTSCVTCIGRHNERGRKKGSRPPAPPPKRICKGCGKPYDECDASGRKGCKTGYHRNYNRRDRPKAKARRAGRAEARKTAETTSDPQEWLRARKTLRRFSQNENSGGTNLSAKAADVIVERRKGS